MFGPGMHHKPLNPSFRPTNIPVDSAPKGPRRCDGSVAVPSVLADAMRLIVGSGLGPTEPKAKFRINLRHTNTQNPTKLRTCPKTQLPIALKPSRP